MEDNDIVALYWARDDKAILESNIKYGPLCRRLAYNILQNNEDVEECLNDTWLGAWKAMPPHRPAQLKFFLGRITRNLSFNRMKHSFAAKRGKGELPVVLDELHECIPDSCTVENEIDVRELERLINQFLRTIPARSCNVFLRRYWYAESIAQISQRYNITASNVKMVLSRTRRKLKDYLEKEDIVL